MRKLLLSAVVLCAAVALSITVAAQAGTSGTVTVQWKCAPPSPMHAVPVGDAPDHAFAVQQVKCTATKGEVAGVKNKDGMGTEFAEVTGANAKGHGIFVETLANGDKITYSYTFSGTSKNNILVSGSNKWTATSGTGKFKGITSSGTCMAKGTPDGGAIFDCPGTYTIK